MSLGSKNISGIGASFELITMPFRRRTLNLPLQRQILLLQRYLYRWNAIFIVATVKTSVAMVKNTVATINFSVAMVKNKRWNGTVAFDPVGTPYISSPDFTTTE